MEFAAFRVDVILVDLVGKDEELLLLRELNDVLDVLLGQHLAGRVPGVDDDDGSGVAGLAGLGQGALQLRNVQRPVARFVQVVSDLMEKKKKGENKISSNKNHSVCFLPW